MPRQVREHNWNECADRDSTAAATLNHENIDSLQSEFRCGANTNLSASNPTPTGIGRTDAPAGNAQVELKGSVFPARFARLDWTGLDWIQYTSPLAEQGCRPAWRPTLPSWGRRKGLNFQSKLIGLRSVPGFLVGGFIPSNVCRADDQLCQDGVLHGSLGICRH